MADRGTAWSESDWSDHLTRELASPVHVRYGRARSLVLRVARSGSRGLDLRMSAFFARAPHDVRDAVASWLRSGKRAKQAVSHLDSWIEVELESLHRAEPRRLRIASRGTFHDLAVLAAEIAEGDLREDFARVEPPPITWGRPARRGARRSLRLGSYDALANVVRIHPVLDQVAVPCWFVRYIVFHELLHAVLPAERGRGGRRVLHGAEFRRREMNYADTQRSLAWEKAHIQALLRSTRTSRPIPQPKRRWVQRMLFG